MKFLRSGKVKDIYELDDQHLLFHFTDRISAFDVKFSTPIPRKGEVLCKFAEFWFKHLPAENHYVRTEGKDKIVVKKMKMIPLECVVRGYFYGSLVQRWKEGKANIPEMADSRIASQLPKPIFDPTTKSETHDVPISKNDVVARGLTSSFEFEWLKKTSLDIYEDMYALVKKGGFILADLKLEFGKIGDRIVLGDSIGPDECRMWPHESYTVGKKQESYDKQLLRDWLISEGFKSKFDDAAKLGTEPVAPQLPMDLCDEISRRYVTAYERITGSSL